MSQQATPRIDILEKLLTVFTEEQALQFVDKLDQVRRRALGQDCDQQLTIIFTRTGHPQYMNGSDNARFLKPKQGE